MASNVTRDHHLLTRNLKTNGKYISSDGSDEGILIDGGFVKFGNQFDDSRYFEVGHASGVSYLRANSSNYTPLTISTGTQQIAMESSNLKLTKEAGSGDYSNIVVGTYGATTISTIDSVGARADFTLDINGQLNFDLDVGIAEFLLASTKYASINTNAFQLFHTGDPDDLFKIEIGSNGATTFTTVDDSGANAHLYLKPDGNVGINSVVAPASKLEVFNTNVQYSTGTASQSSTAITGSGTTFTVAMVGGRFIFDDGTDAGTITAFINGAQIVVSTSQTVSSGNYKIYYPSVQIETGGSSTTLKLGDVTIGTEDINLGLHGDFTVNAHEDIALSADGGNVTMNDGSITVFDFDVDNVILKMMDDADTGDYFSIGVGSNGATTITTVDDNSDDADLVLNIDGNININPADGHYTKISGDQFWIAADTKAASGTGDATIYASETLNLGSGEAGGSDVHYGIRYVQTQSDLTGWDSVYLMHLTGGVGKIISVDNNANLALSNDRKVIFGDAGEYIAGDGTDLSIVSSNHMTVDAAGDIILDAAGENITLKGSAGNGLDFVHHHTGSWDISNLTQDKDIKFIINDGGVSRDILLLNSSEPYVQFPYGGVGFLRQEATFSTTGVIGSGGTDDTDIDFRIGNKFRLELTGDITTVNLIFPTVSGNFLIVCTTNGDHDVTNWKAYESDESAATVQDVMWAGGSVPAFTNNGIDIVSFYWDASEQQAYGVASLAFAVPS